MHQTTQELRLASPGGGNFDYVAGLFLLSGVNNEVYRRDVRRILSATVKAVEAVGGVVSRVVCIMDRLQGAREKLAGYDFQPLFTLEEIFSSVRH